MKLSAFRCDTLIIGAGAAGLAAGRTLAEHGQHVILIEARDRTGGRILTEYIDAAGGAQPVPIELGAEFIHGLPSATLETLREARLDWYELAGDGLRFSDSKIVPEAAERAASHVIDSMVRWLDDQPSGTDMSFAEFLNLSDLAPALCESATVYVEGFNAADRNRISIAALARQQRAEEAIQGDRLFHINHGYGALPDYLAGRFAHAGGRLLLKHRAKHIRWRAGQVEVSINDDVKIQAARAIVTLPLGVLQAGAVNFDPLPGRVMQQIARMVMGNAKRATLVFKTKFWQELPTAGNLSFLFAPENKIPTWWTPMPDPAPLITAWIGGPQCVQTNLDLDLCLSELSMLFSRPLAELRKNLSSWHTHDWATDEFARGAYSYAASGGVDASTQLAEPIKDTLYFAGEHTDNEGHWGTVHTALSSGQRAAARILGR